MGTEGKTDAAGFVRFADAEHAKWVIDNLDRKVPNGFTNPITVRLAGAPPTKGEGKGDGGGKGGKGDGKGKGKDGKGGKGKGKDGKGKGGKAPAEKGMSL